MNPVKNKWKLQLFLWSAVLILSVGGNIVLSSPTVSAQTVYITRTGSKYHTHKCGNGTYFPASLSEAQSQGLTPCNKCFGGSSPSPSNNSSSRSSQSRQKPKSIKISKTSLCLVKGQTSTLKIKNATNKIHWKSSKKSVASISAKGKVKAKRKGKTTITASVGSQKKRCKVTVETPKLSAANITLDVGKSRIIKLSGCSHSVNWSTSNSEIVKVKAGKITAKLDGTVIITAKVHNKKYKCRVKVNKLSADQLILKQNYVKMGFDEEYTLSIRTNPRSLLENYGFSAWSSDESIVYASESSDNSIVLESGTETGTASVYISVGNITKECKVEVGPKTINSITLNKNEIILEPYKTSELSFTSDPKGAIDDYEAIWKSSNENVITVTPTYFSKNRAIISAISEGTADITVTIGEKSAVCHITVTKPQVESLGLNMTGVLLRPGERDSLSCYIYPNYAVDYYDAIWSSSDENIVKVEKNLSISNNIIITALNEGKADIIVTVGNKTAICHVLVKSAT